jgi:hypothetical protein
MSEANICNLSLGRLQVGQAISSLNDTGSVATICARFYHQCRQEVLRAFPWSFASIYEVLAQEADQSYPGWAYVYGYPVQALRLWAVSDISGIRSTVSYYGTRASRETYDQSLRFQMPYKIALRADHEGRVILSDMPNAYGYFTFNVTNTTVYPPDFNSVLAWRLAMEVGGPLKAKRELISDATQQYVAWMGRASATDMNEGRDDVAPESESISCRY